MPRSPRAEALRLLHTEEIAAPPEMPALEPGSPEALNFLETLKEPHFANLASVIDLLFEEVSASWTQPLPYGSRDREISTYIAPRSGWQELSLDIRDVFRDATRRNIQRSETYKRTGAYARIIGGLDRARWIDLSSQLEGGVGTGISSVLTLLRNAPQIVRHHHPENSEADIEAIVRHPSSTILLRRLAKISINQMMAAQSALVGETERSSWVDIDKVLDPGHFKIETMADGSRSLNYAGFDDLHVPTGYTPHYTVKPTTGTARVADIPGHESKVIGCPVTLLKGRLGELLNWGMDAVKERQLWDEVWPPEVSLA